MTLEIAVRLTEMRRAHGYSQEDLAEKLGISRQAVSKWERAESSPDTDNLIALAKLYGVSLDELLGLQPPAQAQAKAEMPAEEEDAPAIPEPAAERETQNDLPPEECCTVPSDMQEGKRRRSRRWSFPYPVLVTAVYLLLGFVWDLWHPGWLLYLTIPLFYLPRSELKPLRLLGNPVMLTLIYLLLGFVWDLWHPGWLVFLLVPLMGLTR